MSRGRKPDLDKFREVVAMWNSQPYPTLDEIGEKMGVTRQRVQQMLVKAVVYGIPVLSADERSVSRMQAQALAMEVITPKCGTCGKKLNLNNKTGFCTDHRYDNPEVREKYRQLNKARWDRLKQLEAENARLKGDAS